jgi:hypothetical protein
MSTPVYRKYTGKMPIYAMKICTLRLLGTLLSAPKGYYDCSGTSKEYWRPSEQFSICNGESLGNTQKVL